MQLSLTRPPPAARDACRVGQALRPAAAAHPRRCRHLALQTRASWSQQGSQQDPAALQRVLEDIQQKKALQRDKISHLVTEHSSVSPAAAMEDPWRTPARQQEAPAAPQQQPEQPRPLAVRARSPSRPQDYRRSSRPRSVSPPPRARRPQQLQFQPPAQQQQQQEGQAQLARVSPSPMSSLAGFDIDSVDVKDYATLQHMMREVQQNIAWRQANIGAMTQEVARLRSQLGSAEAAASAAPSQQGQRAPAASPSASPSVARSGSQAPAPIQQSAAQYGLSVAAVVFLGGMLLPSWEDKLGLGGAAYYDLITSLGLPSTLAEVDPIVASHCGGIIGVLTAYRLMGGGENKTGGGQ